MEVLIEYTVCIISGYLVGSILFARILVAILRGQDIREMGNKNPGAQNIYLYIGKALGALTGLLDSFKALIPMIIANQFFRLSDLSLGLIGIGAILGHIYPAYFKFNGGRGTAVIMGIFVFFVRWELLIAFIIAPVAVYLLFKKNQSVWLPFAILMTTATLSMFVYHSVEIKVIIISIVILGWTYNIQSLPPMVKMILKRE